MPGYQEHLVGGLASYFLCASLFKTSTLSPQAQIILILITLLGSLFPDVDIKSKGQKIFYILLGCVSFVCINQEEWNTLIWLGVIGLVPLLCRHRGLMHNPYMLIAVPWILTYAVRPIFPQVDHLSPLFHFFFTIGAFSHLILDYGLTKTVQKFLSRKHW